MVYRQEAGLQEAEDEDGEVPFGKKQGWRGSGGRIVLDVLEGKPARPDRGCLDIDGAREKDGEDERGDEGGWFAAGY